MKRPAKQGDMPPFPMRVNKYLALKKQSTRRGADELIKDKKVFINGKLAVLGDKVQETDNVEVRFRGKPAPFLYFAYNKARGVTVNAENLEETEKTSFPYGVFPIGGLDKDSEGLVIFTNDGRITESLISGAYEREYVVSSKKPLRTSFKEKIEAGIQIENEQTKPCEVKIINENVFRILLTEEKKHQVRRMCSALFQEANEIQRVRIANIELGKLNVNSYRKIDGEELKTFLTELGFK